MNVGAQPIEATSLANDLSHAVASWKRQYKMLGDRLGGLKIFHANLNDQHPDKHLSAEVIETLLPVANLYEDSLTSSVTIERVLEQCLRLESRAKEQPGGDESGRVYGALHSLVNVLSILHNTSESIITLLAVAKSMHDENVASRESWKKIQAIAQSGTEVSCETISNLDLALTDFRPYLNSPRTISEVSYSVTEAIGDSIFVLVIEDDNAWLPEVETMIHAVAGAYRTGNRVVEVGIARTYEDAIEKLTELSLSSENHWFVLMILDIGLPHDAEELEQIEQYTTTVGRKWGRELLRHARGYKQRHNVVIFTSITNYLEDHRSAIESGVAPNDFILKGPGAIKELELSIHRILSPMKAPRLEIFTDLGERVRLNGVEVELDRTPFRTLSVLAHNRRRGLRTDEIADLLEQSYPGEYKTWADVNDHWDLAQKRALEEGHSFNTFQFSRRANEILRELNAPVNAFEAWRAAVRSQGGDSNARDRIKNTLITFHSNCTEYMGGAPWQWFCEYAKVPHTSPASWGEKLISKVYRVASKSLTLANLRPDGFDPESIHDHVYQIRTQMYASTHLDPSRFVLVTEEGEEGFRYRVVADVVFRPSGGGSTAGDLLTEKELCKVLVVENEPEWSAHIESTLRSAGYAVERASTVSDAVEVASRFRPHILCLDLHIPEDNAELYRWEKGEAGGPYTGGIKVLQSIQTSDPAVKAVILSTFAQDDQVRVQATRAGVDVHDVVPKASLDSPWEGKFLRAIWKNEQEIRRGVLLPSTDDTPFVFLRLDERGPRARGAVITSTNGERWVPFREKEFALLSYLRDSGYRPVARDELLERLYGEEWPDKQEAFDNVLKRLRQAVVQNGLGLSGDQARKLGTSIIRYSSGTYLLKCKVM